jgi:two-component system chemotaxis sensor kinase CheA
VVRTNVEKLRGSIDLSSQPGKGATVSITIPLTVAVLPAMLVGVGEEIYAVPLNSIIEIVRPASDQLKSIGGSKVMRLRDTVLPLISASEVMGSHASRDEEPFAVVLQSNDRRAGLMVTRVIGQQEVVVKALDGSGVPTGARTAVSGATVRDDGGVSLIVDVAEVVRASEQRVERVAA